MSQNIIKENTNKINRIGRRLAFPCIILVLILLGCTSDDSYFSSYDNSCVTPDGLKIGIIVRDPSRILLDAKTGKIIKREKSKEEGEGRIGSPGHILCSDNNEVLAIYPKAIVNLVNGSKIRRSGGKPIGKIGEDKLLSYSGGEMERYASGSKAPGAPIRPSDYYKGEPLELYLENLSQQNNKNKPTSFPLTKFEGVKKDAFYYWILPIRLLEKGELLVIAGRLPEEYNEKGNFEIQPDPWGFFKINPENNEVVPFGKTKMGDSEINLFVPPKRSATSDGKIIALSSAVYTDDTIAVFEMENDKEIFRKKFFEGEEVVDILLDEKGERIAVTIKYSLERKQDSIQYSIRIYDIQTGKELKEFAAGDSPSLVSFKKNELIFNNYPAEILKINTSTGENIWKTDYFKVR